MTVTILKANKKSIYAATNIYWLTFMCQALSWILKLCKSAKQAVLHLLTAFIHISMNSFRIGLLSVLFFYSRLFNKVDWELVSAPVLTVVWPLFQPRSVVQEASRVGRVY